MLGQSIFSAGGPSKIEKIGRGCNDTVQHKKERMVVTSNGYEGITNCGDEGISKKGRKKMISPYLTLRSPVTSWKVRFQEETSMGLGVFLCI